MERAVIAQDEVGFACLEDILGNTPVLHDEDARDIEPVHHVLDDFDVDACGQAVIVQEFVGRGVPVTGDDQRTLSGVSVSQGLCSRLKYNGQQQKCSGDISFHKTMH